MKFESDPRNKYVIRSETHYITWSRNPVKEHRVFYCYRRGPKSELTNNYLDKLIGCFSCRKLGIDEAWRQAKQVCEDDFRVTSGKGA